MNKAWWIAPFLVILALAVAAGGAAQTAVPYAVYTLF
jgi:hypothetical protein